MVESLQDFKGEEAGKLAQAETDPLDVLKSTGEGSAQL